MTSTVLFNDYMTYVYKTWEPGDYPKDSGHKVVYTLEGVATHQRAQSCTQLHTTLNILLPVRQSHIFRLKEETGEPRRNPQGKGRTFKLTTKPLSLTIT